MIGEINSGGPSHPGRSCRDSGRVRGDFHAGGSTACGAMRVATLRLPRLKIQSRAKAGGGKEICVL